jgi:hypothetical protein
MKFHPVLPAQFDVVLCKFPTIEEPDKPGPKARPCLVIRTASTLGDEEFPQVRVIFGTSNPKIGRRPFDFYVCNMTEMEAAGLFYPTRFDMDKRLWLPWTEEYFPNANGYHTPQIGHLSDKSRGSFMAKVQRRAREGLEG